MDPEKYIRLKREVERAQKEAFKAAGALEEVVLTMERDHRVKTAPEIEAKIAKLERKAAQQSKEFKKACDAFEKEFGEI